MPDGRAPSDDDDPGSAAGDAPGANGTGIRPADADGGREYRKTVEGALARLRKYYGEEGSEGAVTEE
ncbi:hypothetical protein [Candidatus Halobonum tyrrellensis]|uniref:Uncharacterized protein n=1 Tax=Candidatus Halobonum tyrrellensis G22 TaxID=1324957 RepID=V4GQL5_9EURY|nr:hypothetical protein [Candidatus Halobonum tyrrellensis]ESP87311.1 hypothetical protein K933_14533 [Candidatus Halobonum tyrrellensis G22]